MAIQTPRKPSSSCIFTGVNPHWHQERWHAHAAQTRSVAPAAPIQQFSSSFLSLCLSPAFHNEISRQDRLETTIANSIDPLHPRFCPSSCAFPFPTSALMKNDPLFGRCAKQNVTHLMTYASHSHGRVGAHHPRRRRAQLRASVAKP